LGVWIRHPAAGEKAHGGALAGVWRRAGTVQDVHGVPESRAGPIDANLPTPLLEFPDSGVLSIFRSAGNKSIRRRLSKDSRKVGVISNGRCACYTSIMTPNTPPFYPIHWDSPHFPLIRRQTNTTPTVAASLGAPVRYAARHDDRGPEPGGWGRAPEGSSTEKEFGRRNTKCFFVWFWYPCQSMTLFVPDHFLE